MHSSSAVYDGKLLVLCLLHAMHAIQLVMANKYNVGVCGRKLVGRILAATKVDFSTRVSCVGRDKRPYQELTGKHGETCVIIDALSHVPLELPLSPRPFVGARIASGGLCADRGQLRVWATQPRSRASASAKATPLPLQ